MADKRFRLLGNHDSRLDAFAALSSYHLGHSMSLPVWCSWSDRPTRCVPVMLSFRPAQGRPTRPCQCRGLRLVSCRPIPWPLLLRLRGYDTTSSNPRAFGDCPQRFRRLIQTTQYMCCPLPVQGLRHFGSVRPRRTSRPGFQSDALACSCCSSAPRSCQSSSSLAPSCASHRRAVLSTALRRHYALGGFLSAVPLVSSLALFVDVVDVLLVPLSVAPLRAISGLGFPRDFPFLGVLTYDLKASDSARSGA